MPAKRIIVLDKIDGPQTTYRFVMWADVPLARRPFYADANKVSEWKDASAADNTALQSGAVVERADIVQVVPGSTLASIRAEVQARWTAFQDGVTNNNLWARYGEFWDGTSWTTGGVS